MLKFLGLQKGMRVADPFGGNLYWAEITAPAVGPEGPGDDLGAASNSTARRVYDNYMALKAKQPNVWLRVSPMEAPDLPAANMTSC